MSKSFNLFLQGQSSFSSAQLSRLKAKLKKNLSSKISLTANDYFLINSKKALDTDKLKEVLHAEETLKDCSFYIGARLGTISPWSSKAGDILKNIGFDQLRIEKFVGFNLVGFEIDDFQLEAIFDPMTQSIFQKPPLEFFDSSLSSKDQRVIDFCNKGIDALKTANSELGLALSNDEIEYLDIFYSNEKRDPTESELMMFAQANSEHCRHKIFNADWSLDSNKVESSLFDLIKQTSKGDKPHLISAYKDNAAVISGEVSNLLEQNSKDVYKFESQLMNSLIKVETHNHPTAISPFPGAATGSGGEIRDEGATGSGAKPKTGLVGFNVSNLNLDDDNMPKQKAPFPNRIASPKHIMIEGPIGAAAFNNEFGRPCTLGYFRVLQTKTSKEKSAYGYHKPIMLAGGIGQIKDAYSLKGGIDHNHLVIVLGGPSMLIGLGGGAASSVSSGESEEELDFASVQRGNAEMERRCQEVINTCISKKENIIKFIHDVGAGGLSNAIPELAKDTGWGVDIDLGKVPVADKNMTPMEIWCNESQERYVLAIHPDDKKIFEDICSRERCPYAIVGKTIKDQFVRVASPDSSFMPVNVPLDMLFGDLPKTKINVSSEHPKNFHDFEAKDSLEKNILKVLRHPTVGSKQFLITIGDRTVGGLIARDQMVGKYQVPTSNYSMVNNSFTEYHGEAISMGEKPSIAISNPSASMRMALAESIFNLMSAPIKSLDRVVLSANWMAACGSNKDDLALREGVEALSKICCELDISIPVGKDSLSMRSKWVEEGQNFEVKSPLTGVISAMAPVIDTRLAITTELESSSHDLYYIKLSDYQRMGGSILALIEDQLSLETPDVENAKQIRELFNLIQNEILNKKITALHDISDGGMLAALCELSFTNKVGLDIFLSTSDEQIHSELFNEELGLIIQYKGEVDELSNKLTKIGCSIEKCGVTSTAYELQIFDRQMKNIFSSSCVELEKAWQETSTKIRMERDNPVCVESETNTIEKFEDLSLIYKSDFKYALDLPEIKKGIRPKVAILREQGVNGHIEMAAAFTLAGFDAIDLHMQDLIDGSLSLDSFHGFAACGGFSYGDVLGAGGGWASNIKFSEKLQEMFSSFFEDQSKFVLGVCNGCQMLSHLKNLIPGANHWPRFVHNESEQFEARLSQVKVGDSDSILLRDMRDWMMPVAVAHAEGRAVFEEDCINQLYASKQVAINFSDSSGNCSNDYPINPNGSIDGATGFTAADGRVTIMMPHPERVFRMAQLSWHPKSNDNYSPWMQMFINAYKFTQDV